MADKDNEISENIEKLIASMPDRLYKAMTDACAIVRNDAIQNAPKGTGTLKRSIDFQVSDDGTEGVVFSNLDYAPYVEVGTGIYSSKGGGRDTPWTFPYYEDGEIKFASTVGMKPRPFLEPALQTNTSKIRDIFEGLLKDE